MPRKPRIDVGGVVYHALNRGNAKLSIFHTDKDYVAFENIIDEAKMQVPGMRVLAYTMMPNHFHFVLYPQKDGELSKFMRWMTQTHTSRWHHNQDTIGTGHLYQGRYKSFPVENDNHLLTLCRYVERNPLRARLVAEASEWQWGSLWRREHGSRSQKQLLDEWPLDPPEDYLKWVNEPQTPEELDALRLSVAKGKPYGGSKWNGLWSQNKQDN